MAVDLGASSGRVALGTVQDGRLEVEILHRFPNGGVPVQGRLYWDVLGLWREVLRGLSLAAQHGPVSSVGVNSWAVDYALLDRDGELMGGVRHYRDPRTESQMERAFGRLPREQLYQRTGIQFLPFNTAYQLRSEPQQRLEQAATVLLLPDLLHHWLGGPPVAEISNASTTQLYDPQARAWALDVLEGLELPARLLPRLVEPGTVLGPLSAEVARETGLSGAQVVAPATHDTASAVAAVPAQGEDWAYVSSGTWSLVGLEVPEPVITPESLHHNLTNEAGVAGTTRLLKNVMGLWMVQECCRAWGRTDFAELYAEAGQVAPGGPQLDPDDPRFLPAGLDMPERIQAVCRERGQPVPDGQAAVVRCILDSLARRTAEVLSVLERVSGRTVSTVHVVGGGSQIGLLNQLIADASGRRVLAGPVEATLLGNLLVQAQAMGAVPTGHLRAVVRASVELTEYLPHSHPQAASAL